MVQGDALSRMDRESAARTFHTFMYAGYFNRFMKLRHIPQTSLADLGPAMAAVFAPDSDAVRGQAPQPGVPGASRQHGSPAPPERSDYGEIAPVWRFFEQVGPPAKACKLPSWPVSSITEQGGKHSAALSH